jgi:hypothetical protein
MLLLHLFLLVIPRYLYPITPVLWVFSAVAMVRLWEYVRSRRRLLQDKQSIQNESRLQDNMDQRAIGL